MHDAKIFRVEDLGQREAIVQFDEIDVRRRQARDANADEPQRSGPGRLRRRR